MNPNISFNEIYDRLISGEDKLALVGLGYVGMPIAVEFAKHIKVIGFDINEQRVNEYKNGIDATNEVGPAIKNTTVEFTADPKALRDAKFIIVAVPTPVNEDTTPDLRPVEGASRTVGQNLTPGTIVVFESTVYPGVTEDICIPIPKGHGRRESDRRPCVVRQDCQGADGGHVGACCLRGSGMAPERNRDLMRHNIP